MVKYLLAVPVLVAMLIIFSSSQNAEKLIEANEIEASSQNINVNITTSQDFNIIPKENLIEGSKSLFGIKSKVQFASKSFEKQGDPIFKVVEEMPRFPGCEDQKIPAKEKDDCAKKEMLNFIYQNVTYPAEARNAGIEGMSIIQFIVEKDGKISNAKITRNVEGGCGREALRIVNTMPVWTPGYQRGKAVRVQYTLPVKFKLEGKKHSDEKKNSMANVTGVGQKSDKATKENLKINDDNTHEFRFGDNEIYKVVEEMPRFSGCEDSNKSKSEKVDCAKQKMLEFIYTNIKYPKEARDKGVEGVAVIQLIIEIDGSISSTKILRDPGAGTGAEAMRVADLMPKWIPGKQSGRLVRLDFTLPIRFKLDGNNQDAKLRLEAKQKIETEVDRKPLFPGASTEEKSVNKLLDFVFKNVTYPKDAIQNNIEGMVIVNFVIGSDGKIHNVNLKKSLGWGIDETVLNMMDNMTEIETPWTPAILDNKSVNSEYVLPVKFKLQNDQIEESKSRQLKLSKLNISPNPSNGLFNLVFDIDDKSPADITFYSINGQVLKTLKKVNIPFIKSIDLSEYKGQTVLINILQKDKIHIEKIIIQ